MPRLADCVTVYKAMGVCIDCFTVSLHSPNGRFLPAVMAAPGGLSVAPQKSWKFLVMWAHKALWLRQSQPMFRPANHKRVRRPYLTDSPNGTRLGLCSSLLYKSLWDSKRPCGAHWSTPWVSLTQKYKLSNLVIIVNLSFMCGGLFYNTNFYCFDFIWYLWFSIYLIGWVNLCVAFAGRRISCTVIV